MRLSARILGCGSSGGVPRLGGADGAGNWGACDPGNPRNRRSRCSLLVTRQGADGVTRVLVDTSPDMRQQLLDARTGTLDGVLITHDHADQTHGLDDLRAFTISQKRRMDVWGDVTGLGSLKRKFGYCFEQPPGSDYPPILTGHVLPEPFAPFEIPGSGGPVPVLAFGVGHGRIRALGFRFGGLAYTPDVDRLDQAALTALAGLDCWIVDALRHTPHPSHATVDRALEWISKLKPRRAILTNMHIDLDYEALRRTLPNGVEPAYDGMTMELAL
jgi:phosphoribosyl 1,2-cyclic phosphate phosphodiesterase